MEPTDFLIVTLLVALLIMVISSVYVVKDKFLSKRQKFFQLILIFSLPFLGALVAWTINQIMEQDNLRENQASGSPSHDDTTVTPTDSSGSESD